MNINAGSGVVQRMREFMLEHMFGMITCREFADFIYQYHEGELSSSQTRVFRRHMRICKGCRQFLEAYQKTVEAGKSAFSNLEATVPEDVPEDLVKAILDARKR